MTPYLHGNDRSRYEFSVVADGEVPRSDPHQVIKIKLHYQSSFGINLKMRRFMSTFVHHSQSCKTHLGEHWLAMLGDHSGLITVQGDHGLVEGFFGMFELPVEVGDSTLKYTPEEPRNESSPHG